MYRKKMPKKIIIITISFILTVFLLINIAGIFIYNKGLKVLPSNMPVFLNLKEFSRFNELLWISETGNTAMKITPVNQYKYFLNIYFNRGSMENYQKMPDKNGWRIANQAAKLIIINSENQNKTSMIDWHFDGYTVFIWVSKNISADKCLNIIADKSYFGNGYYGIQKAAAGYFGKKAEDLSDDEIIYLLTVFSNPILYDPVRQPGNFKRKFDSIRKTLQNEIFLN
ncbi:MAG: transglycosylase domain-containing protein [Spirochaetes bacterium]|nr:transglycosylase domain-containing protein [Spirochaetota bacterium]